MNQRLTRTAAVLAILLIALVLAGCGGGTAATPASTAAPVDSSHVTPLTGPEATGDMGIKAADGSTPCGVFNVNGFGNKVAVLADFPGCTAKAYTVMCLDGSGQWQSTNITNVALGPNKKQVNFTSAQEGACGLFATK